MAERWGELNVVHRWIVAVFAQLRVDTIRDNTRRGLAHARAHGRVGGRPSVITPERTAAAVRMHEQGQSIAHIARVLGVGASSVPRVLTKAGEQTTASLRAFLRVTRVVGRGTLQGT